MYEAIKTTTNLFLTIINAKLAQHNKGEVQSKGSMHLIANDMVWDGKSKPKQSRLLFKY